MVQPTNAPPSPRKSKRSRVHSRADAPLFGTDKEYRVRGERALWRAVIVQALMDAACTSAKTEAKHAREEALHWLTSMSADFRLVCDRAGLDAHYVRRVVKKALLTRSHCASSRRKQPRLRITRAQKDAAPGDKPGGSVLAFLRPASMR